MCTHAYARRVRRTARYSLNNCADSDARTHARTPRWVVGAYAVVRWGVDAAAANVQSGGRWRQRGVSPNECVRGAGSARRPTGTLANVHPLALTPVRSSRDNHRITRPPAELRGLITAATVSTTAGRVTQHSAVTPPLLPHTTAAVSFGQITILQYFRFSTRVPSPVDPVAHPWPVPRPFSFFRAVYSIILSSCFFAVDSRTPPAAATEWIFW